MIDGRRQLVWVGTHRSDTGAIYGPLAGISPGPAGPEVRVMGAVVGPGRRVRLRALPSTFGEAYLIEGERCEAGECTREAQLLVASGPRLIPVRDGTPCPLRLFLRRRGALTKGSERYRFTLRATARPSSAGLRLRERVSVELVDRTGVAHPVREVTSDREIRIHGDRAEPESSLLARLMGRGDEP